jgi:hypothetical protein
MQPMQIGEKNSQGVGAQSEIEKKAQAEPVMRFLSWRGCNPFIFLQKKAIFSITPKTIS